jgi:hypothetical protein
MTRKWTLCLAVVLGLAVMGLGLSAEAQEDVNCSDYPWIVTALGEIGITGFSEPGCEKWKYGMGDGEHPDGMVMWRRPHALYGLGDQPCGPELPVQYGRGQFLLVEPKDSVCDVFSVAKCPAIIPPPDDLDPSPTNVRLDPPNTSHASIEGPIVQPGSVFLTTVHSVATNHDLQLAAGTGGTQGKREAIGGGKTQVMFDWTPDDDDINDILTLNFFPMAWARDGDSFNPDKSLRTGDTLCCTSDSGVLCNLFGQEEYAEMTIPLFSVDSRIDTPPLIFEGVKGSAFMNDPNWYVPGIHFGVCNSNRGVPCDSTGVDPCPGLGDFCDVHEKGLRTSPIDITVPAGFPVTSTCAAFYHVWKGFPVDVGGTGRSTHCAMASYHEPGTSRDPLIGCKVSDFGTVIWPDVNCNGINDYDDPGFVHPDDPNIPALSGDPCPFLNELFPFHDGNGDRRGDECQCGDASGDGILGFFDALAIVQGVQGLADPEEWLWDTDYETAQGTTLSLTFGDAQNVIAVTKGTKVSKDLTCYNHPEAGTPL